MIPSIAEITHPITLKGVTYENYKGIGYLMYLGFEQDEETEEWNYFGKDDKIKIEKEYGLVSNGKFNVKFGSVPSVEFDCSRLGLVSLEGAPTECFNFICTWNKIPVLDHIPIAEHYNFTGSKIETIADKFPEKVKRIDFDQNHLSSFDNFPEELEELIICKNRFESLEGVPNVILYLHASHNRIRSLKGLEGRRIAHLSAENCELTNLEHCPEILMSGNFSVNWLEDLEGIKGPFVEYLRVCDNPKLKSLKGLPEKLFCSNIIVNATGLETLEHITPEMQIKEMNLANSPNLKSIYFKQKHEKFSIVLRGCPNINMYEFFKMGFNLNTLDGHSAKATKGQIIQINYHDTVSVHEGDVVTKLGWTEDEYYRDLFNYLTTDKSRVKTDVERVDNSEEAIIADLVEVKWYGDEKILEDVHNYTKSLSGTVKYNL